MSGRWLRFALQVALFSLLLLATRCANYQDVFIGGRIYFLDADCYSRMTRARLVAEHPGTIVRQHDFENFPAGVVPHTTAPLDYLIAGLALGLRPFTAQSLDLAGAIISPLLALLGGWLLYGWSRAFAWPGRWTLLLVYALSAILVHGTALGRPDHQGLLIFLLLAALAAEWRLQKKVSRGWGIVSGASWGLALWVSLYEPLVLLGALLVFTIFTSRAQILARPRRAGWWILLGLVVLAAVIERRWRGWPGAQPFFAGWSATIGELQPVRLTDPVWLAWVGGLLLVSPLLLAAGWRRGAIPLAIPGLLALSFALTLWQARWGYFFALLFALTIPAQLAFFRSRWLAAAGVGLALFPFLWVWDARMWPNEETSARLEESRLEATEWRAAASSLVNQPRGAILAPWWLAPATAYWSGQPVVAGSSHESLPGIVESARFFLAPSASEARAILARREVRWVMVYDGDRVAENAAAILGKPAPPNALARTLDRAPSQAPPFLKLFARNGACKIYQVQASE